jgi:hypothetical protein
MTQDIPLDSYKNTAHCWAAFLVNQDPEFWNRLLGEFMELYVIDTEARNPAMTVVGDYP